MELEGELADQLARKLGVLEEEVRWNTKTQTPKLRKLISGQNFWLECLTDLRSTSLSYIFNVLFRDTPLGHVFCVQPNSQIANIWLTEAEKSQKKRTGNTQKEHVPHRMNSPHEQHVICILDRYQYFFIIAYKLHWISLSYGCVNFISNCEKHISFWYRKNILPWPVYP